MNLLDETFSDFLGFLYADVESSVLMLNLTSEREQTFRTVVLVWFAKTYPHTFSIMSRHDHIRMKTVMSLN